MIVSSMRIASLIRGGVILSAVGSSYARSAAAAPPSGRDLFTREWVADDSRSGGDGLGPMFNESSCVGCHNQGGIGGGGPESKNVQILSVLALASRPLDEATDSSRPKGLIASTLDPLSGSLVQAAKSPSAIKTELQKLHPELTKVRSTVLHRFSVDPDYDAWRRRFERQTFDAVIGAESDGPRILKELGESNELGLRDAAKASERIAILSARANGPSFSSAEIDGFVVSISRRNTTALYGIGLIENIPAEVILAAAQKKHARFPEVTGRVAKSRDGRPGRFGWKAQHATLKDFTLTACAVELGLDVAGHPQSAVPHKSATTTRQHDLSDDECVALTHFVSSLPRPVERVTDSQREGNLITAGKEHFDRAGCGSCHLPALGEVAGLYSDLLLHDMGAELGDSGLYGSPLPNSTDDVDEPLPLAEAVTNPRELTEEEISRAVGALRQEWRTPPLWGLRDSAPYLHDGRAATLDEAIALHGGEGRHSAIRFFALPAEAQNQVLTFLKSLTAPGLEK